MEPYSPDRRVRPGERFTVGVALVLIASLALGLFLFLPDIREGPRSDVVLFLVAFLAGPSFVGVPWLLYHRLRSGRHRRWGAGRVLWFAHGTAAWLLWPPVVRRRLTTVVPGQVPAIDPDAAKICYFYGTPLMGLYVVIALYAGGWLRRSRRRSARAGSPLLRRHLPWPERFGLGLGLAWALVGVYVLYLIYVGGLR